MEVVTLFRRSSKLFLSVLVVTSMSLLIACSSDSGSDETPPVVIDGVDGTGYYKGTAGIKASDNTTDVLITDLQGLVDSKHFMIISVDEALLFDGIMVFKTETDFTANTAIYQNGIRVGQTTVSGIITQESKITGTFTGTGTGLGNGSFTMDYVFTNSEEADVNRIVTDLAEDEAWDGDFERNYDYWSNWLQVIADGTIVHRDSIQGGLYGGCTWYGSIEAIEGTAIYRVVYNIENFGCQNPELHGTFYKGLATSKSDINVDDTLVFIFSNSSNAGLADMVFTKI